MFDFTLFLSSPKSLEEVSFYNRETLKDYIWKSLRAGVFGDHEVLIICQVSEQFYLFCLEQKVVYTVKFHLFYQMDQYEL